MYTYTPIPKTPTPNVSPKHTSADQNEEPYSDEKATPLLVDTNITSDTTNEKPTITPSALEKGDLTQPAPEPQTQPPSLRYRIVRMAIPIVLAGLTTGCLIESIDYLMGQKCTLDWPFVGMYVCWATVHEAIVEWSEHRKRMPLQAREAEGDGDREGQEE